ncbi:MAG: beta strand repeat-containing protein [Weissella confusa]
MAKLNAAVWTKAGLTAAADLFAHDKMAKISKMSISTTDYTGKDLSALTSMTGEFLSVSPSEIKQQDNTNSVTGAFNSTLVKADSYVRSLGIYLSDKTGNEFLLGVVTFNVPDFIPAGGGDQEDTLKYTVNLVLANSGLQFELTIDDNALAQMSDIRSAEAYADNAVSANDKTVAHLNKDNHYSGNNVFDKPVIADLNGNADSATYLLGQLLSKTIDLNTIKTSGRYFSNTVVHQNFPTDSTGTYFTLEVYVWPGALNGYRTYVYNNGHEWFSTLSSGVWGAWNRVSTINADNVYSGNNIFTQLITAKAGLDGNASTASKLKSPFVFSASGDVTGQVNLDGSGNVTLPVTVNQASKLRIARSIAGVAFDGTANINLPGVNTPGNQSTTGNAATATKLAIARTIGGVGFDGSTNINLPGVNILGNQSTTGNAATATKLLNGRQINGVNFDGTNDIRVDPIVQTVTTNIDVFTLKNGFYYYLNVAATNKLAGSSNYFVVEVTTAPNGLNGFMQVVDSNNNTWWNTLSAGKWAQWKSVANDALVAHLEGDETYKGNKTFTGTITTSKRLNSPALELIGEGGSAYVDFHGKDNASDYSSRIVDDTADLGLKVLNQSGAGVIPAALFANATLPYDLDAVTLGNYNLNSYNHTVVVSTRTSLTGSSPVTNSDGVNIIDNAVVEYKKGAGTAWATQTVTNLWDSMVYERSNKGGSWQQWTKLSNDGDVVHKSGDTMTGSLTVPMLTVNNPINGILAKEPINLLFNTNFDNEMEGWTKHTANATIQTSITGEGYAYVRITAGSAPLTDNAYIEQILDNNIVGGTKTYTLSYESWSSSPNNAGAGAWIVEVDSRGNEIKSSMVDFGSETNWTKHSQTFVASSDTASMKIRFKLNRNKTNVSAGFAKLQLEPAATVGPYVRGSEIQDLSGFVNKTGGTMTGRLINNSGFQAGGSPTSGESGAQIGGNGNIELSAVTPYIDFHANNSLTDYTTRIWDQGNGLLATSNGQNNILTQVLANASNPINIDTMVGGLPALTGVGQSVRVQIDNIQPIGTIPVGLSNWAVLTHYATNSTTAWQELWDISTKNIWRRTKSGNPSSWSMWRQLAMTDSSISGTAAKADKLSVARSIGGIPFDGTASVDLPGVNKAGNQSTSGNAATASKLATARTISLSGNAAAGSASFDGSGNIVIPADQPVTVLSSTADDVYDLATGLYYVENAAVQNKPAGSNNYGVIQVNLNGAKNTDFNGFMLYTDTADNMWWNVKSAGKWIGWEKAVSSDDIVESANKLANARTVKISGDATGSFDFDGSSDVSMPLTLSPVSRLNTTSGLSSTYGDTFTAIDAISTDAKGRVTGINTKSVTLPVAPTNITGNAGTATKLHAARAIGVSGDASGSVPFDGSSNATMPLTLSSVSRINTTSSQSAKSGDTFTVIDSVSTDSKGRTTGVNTKSVKLPSTAMPSNDDDLLHKSGNETITGKKSFSGGVDATSMHATGNIATDSDFHGSLTGNSRMHMRIDIQAYEYTAKGLTFRFIKTGPTAFVNISGNVSQDITSEETLITLGEGSNAKTYAQPYWAGGETTGYKGSAISAGQTGNLSIWDDGSVQISYRGPKVPKGTWLDGSITYISDSPLPDDTIATNS